MKSSLLFWASINLSPQFDLRWRETAFFNSPPQCFSLGFLSGHEGDPAHTCAQIDGDLLNTFDTLDRAFDVSHSERSRHAADMDDCVG